MNSIVIASDIEM